MTRAGALALPGLIAACGQPAPAPPPPPPVDIVTIAATSVPNTVESPGRVQAVRIAEVRARVDGIVERRFYEEGSDVRAGQALFRIDPRERRADFEAALATLQRNRATEVNARQVVDRYRPLVGQQAISKQEYDAAIAQARTGQADVANARTGRPRAADAELYESDGTDLRPGRARRSDRGRARQRIGGDADDEPDEPRRIAAARGGAASGHQHRRGDEQLPDDRRAHLEKRGE